MKWTFEDGRPIYIQIVEQMKVLIASGAYAPGEKIPAVRELAVEAGVNPNTMQKAMSELERDGFLHSERTSGRFVTEDIEVIDEMKKTLSREFVRDLFEKLDRLGMSKEEIIAAVEQWAEEAK
ncbi:MAG: GntR family transcriptional regulator [Clostridiales bacterium]|nr:GntR family transcriptional regulator [Clostridiales bacterium]MDD7035175.1 GntR family transcriptional regulator [Bacillota bacterium]MDY2920021.1 GntR family transcriptional regulator [Lentihominibacter sp.]